MHSYLKIYAPHSYTINKHAVAMTEIWLKKSNFFFYSIATKKAHRKGLGLLNADPRAFLFLGQLWVNTYKPKNVILISLNTMAQLQSWCCVHTSGSGEEGDNGF